jgi:hypothetical protein
METIESAGAPEEPSAAPCQPLAAAAASQEVNDLFTILSEAELVHHDALIEVKEDQNPHRAQFKLLQGGACLCRTSPGKA